MKKLMATLLVALCAFLGMAHASDEGKFVTVIKGDTLTSIGKTTHYSAQALCRANPQIAARKSCNDLRVGDKVNFPGNKTVQLAVKKPVSCINLGAAPFNRFGSTSLRIQGIELSPTLTQEEKIEAIAKIKGERGDRRRITSDMVFKSMPFKSKNGKVSFLKDVNVCTPEQGGRTEVVETWTLSTGTVVGDPLSCGNIGPMTIPKKPLVTTPIVEPPKKEPPPVVESPPADEQELFPFHMTEETAEKPRCELQAGTGVYANRVYQGNWLYGETICYVWQNGEWQAGPGLYAMYGAGHSLMSDYRGKEVGVGLQVGIQRNWINDRNNRVSADLKIRWLSDRSWGSNPESGYAFTQKGQKIGLYAGYAERLRHDKPFATEESDLVGVTAEYWKSFGATVDSTWAQQPAQDRGSVGVAGFYETKLSKDNKWRQRFIGGVAHTNWDEQNWLKGTYEVRYDEWLMFGPQITLPIGVSQPNQPMSARDLTTIGAFVRVELGGKAREAEANNRDAQLEFIPIEAVESPE